MAGWNEGVAVFQCKSDIQPTDSGVDSQLGQYFSGRTDYTFATDQLDPDVLPGMNEVGVKLPGFEVQGSPRAWITRSRHS